MLHNTRGIVLNYIKYGETSIIVRIFTEAFGVQSYIVNSARTAKGRGKMALYQPLSLLEMVVYHKPGKDIQRISEAKFSYAFSSIPFDPVKTGISIFLTEIMNKLLREESENKELYGFIHQAITIFDHLEKNVINFHLQFLMKCSAYLGFEPQSAEGFIEELAEFGLHFRTLEAERIIISQLMNRPLGDDIEVNGQLRRDILSHIIKFYQIHVSGLNEIKSLVVLKEVLS
ncbi:MAG: DNA repair protein RecO (recombination protein O) [Roseivirga sp.]|jgi:DNA repair protein RecO (recombination protein O)